LSVAARVPDAVGASAVRLTPDFCKRVSSPWLSYPL